MKRRRLPKRLHVLKPWDFAGVGIFFLDLGFALMTEVSWRWCEIRRRRLRAPRLVDGA